MLNINNNLPQFLFRTKRGLIDYIWKCLVSRIAILNSSELKQMDYMWKRQKEYLNNGFAEVGREEMEIRFPIIRNPISECPPLIHKSCQNNWLVRLQVSLHKFTVTQFFPIDLLHVPTNFEAHVMMINLNLVNSFVITENSGNKSSKIAELAVTPFECDYAW